LVLSGKYGVAVQTIRNRSVKEKWKRLKPQAKERIETRVQESCEDILVRLGLPKEKRMAILVEGATEPTKLIFEGPPEEKDKDGNVLPTQKICTPVPDYRTRLDYVKEIHALTGDYAPRRVDATSKGKRIANHMVSLPLEDINDLIEQKATHLDADEV
jgi:hypothetical protein